MKMEQFVTYARILKGWDAGTVVVQKSKQVDAF